MSSFTFRVTCRFAVLVTVTTAVVLVIGGFLLSHEMEEGIELLHDIEVHELTELIGLDPTLSAAAVAERIQHDTDSDAELFAIQVASANGVVLFRSQNLGDTILAMPSDGSKHWTATLRSLGRVHLSVYTNGPWRIHIGSPLAASERVLRDYVRMCVPLIIGVAIISVGLGYAFSRATLRPLRAIEATANRIRADQLTERIPVPPGRDELAALTRLLNQMFDRLQDSFEQVRRFTADASHELKTPLALIRLNAEKLRPRLASDPEASAAVADILEEIARLHQVIDRLLFLAKSESGALALAPRAVDVAGLVSAFAEDAEALAEDRGVRFELAENAPGEIQAEPDLLRQLLLNLVANAVAVVAPASLVQLTSSPTPDGWRFVVLDEGPGIPEADLPRVFGRFARVDRADEGPKGRAGHGLGLAICKSIAELHGGAIRAENRQDRAGLRVVVTLPRLRGAEGASGERASARAKL